VTDEEYRILKRRLYSAQLNMIDAELARANGSDELAAELTAMSGRLLDSARELMDRHRGPWVLALPTPVGGPEGDVLFRGKRGLTTDIDSANTYPTYLDAIKKRTGFSTGELFSPEPLDYHQRRNAERSQ
jgi:hypothetical protein